MPPRRASTDGAGDLGTHVGFTVRARVLPPDTGAGWDVDARAWRRHGSYIRTPRPVQTSDASPSVLIESYKVISLLCITRY